MLKINTFNYKHVAGDMEPGGGSEGYRGAIHVGGDMEPGGAVRGTGVPSV